MSFRFVYRADPFKMQFLHCDSALRVTLVLGKSHKKDLELRTPGICNTAAVMYTAAVGKSNFQGDVASRME